MPRERWLGYIKEYDGTTLMECYISPSINHLRLGELFMLQRRRVHQAMRLMKCLAVYSGQALWQSVIIPEEHSVEEKADTESVLSVHPNSIVGFTEAGWSEDLEKMREE